MINEIDKDFRVMNAIMANFHSISETLEEECQDDILDPDPSFPLVAAILTLATVLQSKH